MMTEAERYADKIAKLLRKAESTTPEEAEALVEKAQALMTQYAISEELLTRASGSNTKKREEIIEKTIQLTGQYRNELFDIGSTVARVNDCRVLIQKGSSYVGLHLVGFEGDMGRVESLFTSLQIQAIGSMQVFRRDLPEYLPRQRKYHARREFLRGYADGIGEKLKTARKLGEQAAAHDEALRRSVTTEESVESVALVVRDKKAQVNDWMDKTYGQLKSSSRRYTPGGHAARSAGHSAGLRADIGQPGVGGKSKELGR